MTAKQIPDIWDSGSAYEHYVGRWSRRVAPAFLTWLGIPPGRRWLDVGCGTGALSTAIADGCSPSSVAGVEPAEGYRAAARENLAGRATLHPGSATAIPLGDASVDVVVSGLVLNFVPDPHAALLEMARVTGSGGTVAAYVWDYAGKMELMRYFWDAAVELDPAAAKLDEGVRFPLCRPEALSARFAGAGLQEIEVRAIDIPTPFANFDDYWQPFLGGQGPAPGYATSLDEAARSRLRDRIAYRLPATPDGSITLIARAWAVRAAVA
jgi:SAM-dependent methyltransferase